VARRTSTLRPGVLLLALAIAILLWTMAHGTTNIERALDIPIELHGLKDTQVVTDQSVDAINVRVLGSRAALRNLEPSKLRYLVDVAGSKPGVAEYEVDVSQLELPRGARIVSRSPSHIQVRFEPRGRKAVGVRVDLEGQPPEGFVLRDVAVEPSRVWLSGARSQVMRLSEVVTEPIDLREIRQPLEREVRVFPGGGNVWLERTDPVTVRLDVEPDPELQASQAGAEGDAEGAGPGPDQG
jgi:YbbR domain-containing protein